MFLSQRTDAGLDKKGHRRFDCHTHLNQFLYTKRIYIKKKPLWLRAILSLHVNGLKKKSYFLFVCLYWWKILLWDLRFGHFISDIIYKIYFWKIRVRTVVPFFFFSCGKEILVPFQNFSICMNRVGAFPLKVRFPTITTYQLLNSSDGTADKVCDPAGWSTREACRLSWLLTEWGNLIPTSSVTSVARLI